MSEVQIEVIKTQMQQNTKEHDELGRRLDGIVTKLDKVIDEKVDKSEFIFWRNILVSGILLGILIILIRSKL